MLELPLPGDEAALYVLGELAAAERAAFEERLAESAELRAVVSKLEEGAVALSLAAPRRQPPRALWAKVEQAVKAETKRQVVVPALWIGWWRHGWAAAAACLAGWILYAFWANHSSPSNTSSPSFASGANPQNGTTVVESHPASSTNAMPHDHLKANPALQALQARTQEIGALRWQITDLTNRVTRLSQALAQQEAMLSDPSRLKFFQLTPPSAGGLGASNAPVSAALQRALLLAMARELGWATSAPPWDLGLNTSTRTNRPGGEVVDSPPTSNSVPTSPESGHVDVDFVDLRAGSNNTPAPTVNPAPSNIADPSLASASSNGIPGFISGTNAFVAVDSSLVPSGTLVTFSTTSSWGQVETLGGAFLGNNPTVFTVPLSALALAGGNFTVIAGTPNGTSNIIGQFFLPPMTPP